jgi:acyl-CoA reductase-like NAD-dependent aldehyde dehydrogenase
MERLEVLKTYKIYIGGQFPRTESGRYYIVRDKKGNSLANVCLSSRKDARNAVVAARKAFGSWSEKSAFNRSQILYRIAEMLEGRKEQFIGELMKQGSTQKAAENEVELSIDRIVYYAGWADKFQQIASSVNPVSSSHFNFSVLEPTGVVGVICPQNTSLIGLVSLIIPVITGGNTVVALASESLPLCSITFAEVLNSSDVPGGVVNILTGTQKEVATIFASHMDVNALVGNINDLNSMSELAVDNLKRLVSFDADWMKTESQGLNYVTDIQEVKTTWHPIENIGGASSSY